jgi:hypothetical protein
VSPHPPKRRGIKRGKEEEKVRNRDASNGSFNNGFTAASIF